MKRKLMASLQLAVLMSFFLVLGVKSYGQAFTFPGGSPTTTTEISPVAIKVHGTAATGVSVGHGLIGDVNSTAVGTNALVATVAGATFNTAFGNSSMIVNQTGYYNCGFGSNTLASSVITRFNTAVGASCLAALTSAGGANNTDSYNNALGYMAFRNLTTGWANTGIGHGVGFNLIVGNQNTALGASALVGLAYGSNNVAIGANAAVPGGAGAAGAGLSNDNKLSIQNVIYGVNMTSATNASTSIGVTGGPTPYIGTTYSKLHVGGSATMPSLQLDFVPNGTNSTTRFLYVDNNGVVRQDVASNGPVNNNAWNINGNVGTTCANFLGTDGHPLNFRVGTNTRAGSIDLLKKNSYYGSLSGEATCTSIARANVAIGYKALTSLNDGNENTAIGVEALSSVVDHINNTAIGHKALAANTADENTATGAQSLASNTTGLRNTANGFNTLNANQTGNDNTAMGHGALALNTGSYNTAVGSDAMPVNISGGQNTAVGVGALLSDPGGYSNTATGFSALGFNSGGVTIDGIVYGSCNTANGYDALVFNTTGSYNTAVGLGSMQNNQTGNYNSTLGFQADIINNGSYNTAIGTGAWIYDGSGASISNGTALGAAAQSLFNNSTAVGAYAVTTAINTVWLGDGTCDAWIGSGQLYQTSDQRFKTDVNEDDVKGLEFIKLLRPVVYNFDTKKFKEFTTQSLPDSIRRKYIDNKDFLKSTAVRSTGFLAQEVEQAAKQVNYNFSGVHVPETKEDIYGLAYSEFVVPLVKAVQELSKQNDELKKEMDELKALIKSNSTSNVEGLVKLTQSNIDAKLFQNSPNPFSQSTVIKYSIPSTAKKAVLTVTSISGVKIKEFDLKNKTNQVEISSGQLSAGTYIYSLIVDDTFIDAKQMILTR